MHSRSTRKTIVIFALCFLYMSCNAGAYCDGKNVLRCRQKYMRNMKSGSHSVNENCKVEIIEHTYWHRAFGSYHSLTCSSEMPKLKRQCLPVWKNGKSKCTVSHIHVARANS